MSTCVHLVTSSLVKIIAESPHSWKKSILTVPHALFYVYFIQTWDRHWFLTVQVMINHHCFRWCPCPRQATNHSLQWRHNGRDGVSNHQPDDYSLKRLFRCRSKKTSKLRVTGLWAENFPHKRPIKRKMLPFDDVIMLPESKLTQLNKTCSNFSKPGFCLTLRDALFCLISSSVVLHVITKPLSYHTYF